jgi:hypothetical protein
MNSAGVVVCVRVSRARSIAPIRVRVIGPSALGLDRVRCSLRRAGTINQPFLLVVMSELLSALNGGLPF